ncbi:hypothetical protein [Neptunicella marina]|uniref:Pectate lyase superfamily protein domain-containing protein n=1 Tax=Neptunicella marina TaxID=2125989 RepID=A0A8J6IWQ7_9ALTE|nr:hypothetical protein [Neptunicella marina]MBC3766768.1 hypothetical protein [Neptunicella marina]
MKCLLSVLALTVLFVGCAPAAELLQDKSIFLPDYSYAGYANGERQPGTEGYQVLDVEQFGVHANDSLDDSKALIALLKQVNGLQGGIILQFAPGRYILSDIIYLERSQLVLRGSGSGAGGTEFYFPRPLNYVPNPPELAELRDYLIKLDKVQREKPNNIAIPFTQWAWSGGFFWSRIKGQRVKQYLDSYDTEPSILAKGQSGEQGKLTLQVDDADKFKIGDVIEISWFNTEGKDGAFLTELYGKYATEDRVKIGSHHWQQPKLALARQQVEVRAVNGKNVHISSPLLHNVKPEFGVTLTPWQHLSEVGLEHFAIRFPYAEPVAHHVEQGFNGIYLTRVYNSWVQDVVIDNADSGILTEEIANVSIRHINTSGEKLAHYSVQMGGVHNVLVNDLTVDNPVRHPLSFNTFSTKSVYSHCKVNTEPLLDQHSGVNQQNLFDDIKVRVTISDDKRRYDLFKGGGAGYWKPSHAQYNSFWNIQVEFTNGFNSNKPVELGGMKDGVGARLIGVHGNLPVKVNYAPDAYIEQTNTKPEQISLYDYQLKMRLKQD